MTHERDQGTCSGGSMTTNEVGGGRDQMRNFSGCNKEREKRHPIVQPSGFNSITNN